MLWHIAVLLTLAGTEPEVWISKISRLSSSVTGAGGRVERALQCWQLERPNELIVMISIVLFGVFGYNSGVSALLSSLARLPGDRSRAEEGVGVGVSCLNYRLGMWAWSTLSQGVKWKTETKMWTTKGWLEWGGENMLPLKIWNINYRGCLLSVLNTSLMMATLLNN